MNIFKSKNKKINESKDNASLEKIEETIVKLKGSDRLGNASQIINTVGGGLAGGAAAGTAAAAAGASTIFGSTTIATALGGVFVASTPVGWVVGCAIAGSAAAYGVSRLVRSGGRNDRIRNEIIERLSNRQKSTNKDLNSSQRILKEKLQISLDKLVINRTLSEDQAIRMLELVSCGKLNIEIALARVRDL